MVEACSRSDAAAEWLYLGHSQTSVIAGRGPGDVNVTEALQLLLLHAAGSPPIEVCSISLGGMNMAEGFAVLAATVEHRQRPLHAAVIAVALDQMRSVALRDEVALQLSSPEVRDPVRAFTATQSDLPDAQRALASFLQTPSAQRTELAESPAFPAALAKRIEATLQETAERMPLFARREDMQRRLATRFVTGRNRLLGISSASIRAGAETTYRANLQFLELDLRYVRARHIPIVVYVGPFRPRHPRPFPEDALAQMRRDVHDICVRYGATCLDYMDLLPEAAYSVYPPNSEGLDGQPDFAHLTAAGHNALAGRLFADLQPLVRQEVP